MKKTPTIIWKRKSAFQTITIELCKQPKAKVTKTPQKSIRLVVSIGVDVVAKTDDKLCLPK